MPPVPAPPGAVAPPVRPDVRRPDGQTERQLKEMMDQVERWLIAEALRDHGGNKTKTAETLGITREGLHKKLSKFGLS